MWGLSGSLIIVASIAPSVLAAPPRLGHQLDARGLEARKASATSSAFNPLATDNLGVYYGHAETTNTPSMYDLCENDNVNIVIMGFIRSFNGLNTLPTYDIGSSCSSDGTSSATTCPDLAANITSCQSAGKKVFLSMGGSSSDIVFNSSSDATEAAETLWNVFGAGSNNNATIRPFGNVIIDGFDFDIESGSSTENFDMFAETLQGLFASSTPTRYISAAPLCANNTALPHGFYENTNFVWPRFYNAQACAVGSTGFNSSLLQWDDYVGMVNSNISSDYPIFYIGGLSFNNSNNGGGYVAPDEFAAEVVGIRPNISSNFGGVTLWEGSDALLNKNSKGKDFLDVSKSALVTVSAGSRLFGSQSQVWLTLVLAISIYL